MRSRAGGLRKKKEAGGVSFPEAKKFRKAWGKGETPPKDKGTQNVFQGNGMKKAKSGKDKNR